MRIQDEQADRQERYVKITESGKVHATRAGKCMLTWCTALDEAMDLNDADALGRLYGFTVDVDVFGDFVTSLQAHIEVRSYNTADNSRSALLMSTGTTSQSHL